MAYKIDIDAGLYSDLMDLVEELGLEVELCVVEELRRLEQDPRIGISLSSLGSESLQGWLHRFQIEESDREWHFIMTYQISEDEERIVITGFELEP